MTVARSTAHSVNSENDSYSTNHHQTTHCANIDALSLTKTRNSFRDNLTRLLWTRVNFSICSFSSSFWSTAGEVFFLRDCELRVLRLPLPETSELSSSLVSSFSERSEDDEDEDARSSSSMGTSPSTKEVIRLCFRLFFGPPMPFVTAAARSVSPKPAPLPLLFEKDDCETSSSFDWGDIVKVGLEYHTFCTELILLRRFFCVPCNLWIMTGQSSIRMRGRDAPGVHFATGGVKTAWAYAYQ